jgi:hypothetical protein
MSEPRLNAHGSDVVRDLFEENTNEVKTVGDIVEKHGGDTIILTQTPRGDRAADEGEQDFENEALPSDPNDQWESVDDTFVGDDVEDEEGIGETDITGTAAGIARGFGSHLPLDFGADGFQIEEIPDKVVGSNFSRKEGEELDDYDDDNDQNGKFDPRELSDISVPGENAIARQRETDQTIPQSRFDKQNDGSVQ